MARGSRLVAFVSLFAVVLTLGSLFQYLVYLPAHPPANMASLTHIVLFEFEKGAAPEAVKTACDQFLALKSSCVHPTSQKPYILSLKGGKDNSPEGHQGGITHGFVVEFATAEDRDYYVKTDPAHQAFAAGLKDLITQVRVIDFVSGVY